MTILNSGEVGIGTTTPWGLLSVNPNGITGPSFVIGSSTQCVTGDTRLRRRRRYRDVFGDDEAEDRGENENQSQTKTATLADGDSPSGPRLAYARVGLVSGNSIHDASGLSSGSVDNKPVERIEPSGPGMTSPTPHQATGLRIVYHKGVAYRTDGEWVYDEAAIVDIEAGDEVQSLDTKTGALVWSKVKQVAFMGHKPIFKLTTASGKTIRTTGNHPYLVRQKTQQTLFRFEVDQSGRIEELRHDTVIGIANAEQSFTIIISAKLKRRLNEIERRTKGEMKFFAPRLFADMISEALARAPFEARELVIDIEYTGYERVITRMITERSPNTEIFFKLIGKKSPAHFAAYGVFKGEKNASMRRTETAVLANTQDDRRTVTPLDKSQTIRSPHRSSSRYSIAGREYVSSVPVVDNKNGMWRKVTDITVGQEIAVAGQKNIAHWDKIVNIESLRSEDVYDIEIEGTHNFIGNGIVAHNTAFIIDSNGKVGIGATTTPGSLLSVQGIANFTTATSTFYGTGGINLGDGCFAVDGVCVGGGGSQTPWTSAID
ncbi:MAG: hypothetical protein AAB767_05155, partial [Patescibacteria group bacterium]